MTDDEPWWWPLRKALVKKAADLITNMEFTPPPGKDPLVVQAEFEDLPVKPRRKALPRARTHPAPSKAEDPPSRDDST